MKEEKNMGTVLVQSVELLSRVGQWLNFWEHVYTIAYKPIDIIFEIREKNRENTSVWQRTASTKT